MTTTVHNYFQLYLLQTSLPLYSYTYLNYTINLFGFSREPLVMYIDLIQQLYQQHRQINGKKSLCETNMRVMSIYKYGT